MSDLTLQKWDCAIIDWVNCLEVSKRIQNINALKSGEFFKALLDLLLPDVRTNLNDFFHTFYPKIELCKNDSNIADFTDPELTIAASLLLHFMCIHDRREELIAPLCQKLNANVQTFIKHFLEYFTPETPAAEFNNVVRKAIEGDASLFGTPKRAMEWNSSGESPFVHDSPLFEYFKTPAAKKTKLQEKDREIRRLQQELQLERDEKEDLNIEIGEQKKRLQKITLEIHEKSLTISNLSARLAELEEQPPTNKPKELIDIEKLLQSELSNAQYYITNLQTELGEVSLKREELSKKLKSSEDSACMWQERAVEYETKLDATLAKYKAQEEELTDLQINYNELSTLLDELRQSKTHNSTLELDNSVSTVNLEPKIPEENLASTVVEIQLKECQLEMQEVQIKLANEIEHSSSITKQLEHTKQELETSKKIYKDLEAEKHETDVTLDKYITTNEKLEMKINQLAQDFNNLTDNSKKLQHELNLSIAASQKLEDEVNELKGQLDEVNNNHQTLSLNNEELLIKINTLHISEEDLLTKNQNLVSTIDNITKENLVKHDEINFLKAHLTNCENTIKDNEDLIESLKKDLQVIQTSHADFEAQLTEKNQMFDVLEEESRQLQIKYEDAVDACQTSDFNLNTLQKQFKEMDNKFQLNLDRLEQLIVGSIEFDKMEKFERVELLLEKLASKNVSFENQIDNLKQVNCKLEENISNLHREDLQKQKTLEKVQKLHETSQETVENLEGEIQAQVLKITELEDRLKVLNGTIEELEALKGVVFQRESDILELQGCVESQKQKNQRLCESHAENILEIESLEEKLGECQTTVDDLQNDKQSLIEKVENLESLTLQKESHILELQKNIDVCNEENNNLCEINKENQLAIQSLEENLSEKQIKLINFQNDNELLLKEIEHGKNSIGKSIMHQEELQKQLETLKLQKESDILELQKSIEAHNEENKNLSEINKENQLAIQNLEENISQKQIKLDALQNDNEKLLKEVENGKILIEKSIIHQEELQKQLETLKLQKESVILELQKSIEAYNEENKNLSEINKENQVSIQSLEDNVSEKQIKLNDLQNDKELLLKEVENGKILIEKSIMQQEDLQKQLESIILQKGLDILELQKRIDAHNEENKSLCELMKENKQKIEKLEENLLENQSELNNLQNEKELLQTKLENGKISTENLKETLQNQLETLHNELSSSKQENCTLKVEKHSLNNTIDVLTTNLHSAQDESESNKKTIEELVIEIDSQLLKLKDKDSELSLAKVEFSNKDLENMQMINQLNNKIASLSEIKSSLETDLQLARDECVVKRQDLADLEMSKANIEKNLDKTIKQHVKKIDLMELTISNLEKKVTELSDDRDVLEEKYSKETDTVIALTAEKGQLANDYNQTKNELIQLTQVLQAKETECLSKDDVIEKNSVELLSLKLDIEMKANELGLCKNKINLAEEEKAALLLRVNDLQGELEKTNNNYKSTIDELKVITDMKNSLVTKMDNFKENMQNLFAHYEIKKKNMKQSLEELKKFKGLKEKEIKQLNVTLLEVRAEVEKLKEDNCSVKMELQQLINSKSQEIKSLNATIDALKTTEVEYLHEISMLKEELNYTIDKYTEALQVEKDQRTENDAQIQSLTESLHAMLEKFNALDKEHKELTNILEYNKKSFDELKSDKDGLELEIVRLKNEYEEDAKSCKNEFQHELKTLNKIERSLKQEIGDLQNLLDQSKQETSTVGRELQDAKSHLDIIQTEKAELENKLDDLEIRNNKLCKDYDSLKIAKEAFMMESKQKLIEKQDELEAEKQNHLEVIAIREKEMTKLKKEVSKITDKLKREEETFKRDLEQKKKEKHELQTSIRTFLQNIETLTKEKEGLSKKIAKQDGEHQEMVKFCRQKDEKIAEHLTQIQNLQISHDVLQAGKEKMEKLTQNLQDQLSKLQKQMRDDKQQFEAVKMSLQTQLEKIQAQLRDSEISVKEKCAQIDAANEEFDSVQTILTNMTKKMEASSRQLTVIHEDYGGKLKSERESFEQLKGQYESTLRELDYIGKLNDELKLDLSEARRDREEVEAVVREREEQIAVLQTKYDSVASEVSAKDASIASLQAELASRLGQISDAAGARHALESEHRRTAAQLAQLDAQKEELIAAHASALRTVEENLLRTEGEVRGVLARLETEACGRNEVECLLRAEREAKAFLERRVVDLETQVFEANVAKRQLAENVRRLAKLLHENGDVPLQDDQELDDLITETERKIIVIFGKLNDLQKIKEVAESDRENAEKALQQMEKCNEQLNEEKTKLIESYEKLHEDKAALLEDKEKDVQSLQNLKVQYESLLENNKSSQLLEQKLQQLEANNKEKHETYRHFLHQSQHLSKQLDAIVADRNQLEQIVCNLKDQCITLQIKSTHITETTHKLHFEQKSALEIIIDDIHKQYRRLSKMIYNLNLNAHQAVEKAMAAILNESSAIDCSDVFKELATDEIRDKLEDLKDNATNTQVQLEAFLKSIEAISIKKEKPQVLKENMQLIKQQQPAKEDEWRKKYMNVKQKLTLVENSKNNFEKKIKQLRDEVKKLSCEKVDVKPIKNENDGVVKQEPVKVDNDIHYKKLLAEYIQLKQENQDEIKHLEDKYKKLQDSTILASSKNECQDDIQNELTSLKGSYREVKVAYSKLQLDYSALEQLLSERNQQLSTLTTTKESYSNLCEENTNLKSEIDTLKYKRQRDKEQFLQEVKKLDAELARKVSAVRGEYDMKLEKIKKKMVCKYQDQVDHEEAQRYEKMAALREENEHYKNTIRKLKDELSKAQGKNEILDSEKQYVVQQLKMSRRRCDDEFDFKEPAALSRRASSHSLQSELRNAYIEDRRSTFSLPRNVQGLHPGQMDIIEEVRYRRRTSNVAPVPPVSSEFEMEDEGEMFNNKYLNDLKEDRPSLASGRESACSRLSEFAYRNSLCPPHLKSSYPAETQFLDNRQFKEDDLKSGNIDFLDDTMKTQLLPSEKPKKKDAGTTSYKRPGPPTPSKHGGRSSLQANERAILRENPTETKRVTPNPLRSLFSSSNKKVAALDNGHTSSNSENIGASPKKRPSLNFFRR